MKKHLLSHMPKAFLMALTTGLLLGSVDSARAQSAAAPVPACQAIGYSHIKTIYLVTSSGARCQAGAPLSFKLYKLNDFVTEQACDFSKTINRIRAEDSIDDRVMCAHSGAILEPERRGGYSGIVLRYGHRVNGTIEPLPEQ